MTAPAPGADPDKSGKSLADAYAARPASRAGTPCTVGLILEGLNPADAAEMRRLMALPRTSTGLAEVLRERGHDISGATLRRHGSGTCKCPR